MDTVKSLQERVLLFFKQWVPLLNAYYAGTLREFPSESISVLLELEQNILNKIAALSQNSVSLITQVEEMETLHVLHASLLPIKVFPRWVRATPAKASRFSVSYTKISLNQNEAGSRWISELSTRDFINNDTVETDYNLEGGNEFTLQGGSYSGYEFKKLNSVIDLSEKTARQGKDIKSLFALTSEDIETVTGSACVHQQVYSLLTLKRGDLTSYSSLSLSGGEMVGSNRNMFGLPIIARNIDALIATDDFLLPALITESKIEQDNFVLSLSISTVDADLPAILITV